MNPLFIVLLIIVLWIFSCIHILNEYERGVIFSPGTAEPEARRPWPGIRVEAD